MAGSGSILGNAVLRLEDPTLLTGDGKYVDDLVEPGMLYVGLVRSPVAHGTINSVDLGEAASMPGVVAVFHAGNDLGMPAMQGFAMLPPDFNRPIFASDRVRFVGDVIAAVIAESQAQANDAAEAIVADIDPLPTIVTAADGLKSDAPLLFPDTSSNVCFATEFGKDGGDPCEGADTVAEVTMVSQRLAGVPMETNGVVAVPEDGGVTMWLSHQAPHSIHGAYAPMLGLEPEQLRVVCPWVGGGFGPKAAGYVEHLIAAKAALTLGKPVKWVESRSEDMVSLVHGRDYVMTARLGVNNDGKIVGLDAEVTAAAGAYPAIGAILPLLTQMMSVGVYEIPKVRFDGKTVLTNNTTVGAYRGAGRPEATQLIERVLDVAADKIGIDPAEIRRVNFMQPDTFPRTTITGANYDSGEYEKALDAVLAASGYTALRAEQATRRASGDTKQIGIGLSAYVEVTAPVGLHIEWGACEVNADGSATVFAGTSVHGQGHHTAFAMLASDVLGIPMDKITLVNSDTTRVPRGSGTLGSRSLQTAGSAIHVASEGVLERAKQIAAHMLEAAPDDIVVGDGGLQVAGVPVQRRVVGRAGSGIAGRRQAAGRCRAGCTPPRARFRRHRLHVPVRGPRVRRRSRHRNRWRHDAAPHRRRRLRSDPQPAAGAWPAARWHRPRRCPGVVRARDVRRRRQPDHVEPDGLRDPVGGRVVQLRDVEHADRQPAQPARCQGHRRVGHDRLHTGDPERRRRRRLAPRCHPHRHAVHGRACVGGHQQRPLTRCEVLRY